MQLLSTLSGGPGEVVALLTQQGDALACSLASPGSLASPTPLSSVLYVDGGSTATGTPDGSIGSPFRTVQAACAAAPNKATILVCPFDNGGSGYLEDVVVPANIDLTIQGLGSGGFLEVNTVAIRSITASGNLVLCNLDTQQVNAVGHQVELVNVNLVGAGTVSVGALFCWCQTQCTIAGAVSADSIQAHNYRFESAISVIDCELSTDNSPDGLTACNTAAIDTTGNCVLKNMQIGASITADNVVMHGCLLSTTLTITCTSSLGGGAEICKLYECLKADPASIITFVANVEGNNLLVDTFTNQWMNNSVFPTFALLRVWGACALETQSVVVPGVAAGAVGYADVTMSGECAGVTTTDVVVANPTADLVAAGAGGGYINCRVSALNTVRLAFVGPLAGGASNFQFVRLTRTAQP